MKKTALILFFAGFFMYVSTAIAQETSVSSGLGWQSVYEDMLEKGKITIYEAGETDTGGLGYTPTEATILEEAVTYALSGEKGDRACECMKIAVEYEYNPYLVLKTIYGVGGDLEIDQLCSCATEAGVTKAIIAQAATDAVTPLDKPVYEVSEISRSQCLTGLAYQEDPGDPPPPVPPEPVSPVVP